MNNSRQNHRLLCLPHGLMAPLMCLGALGGGPAFGAAAQMTVQGEELIVSAARCRLVFNARNGALRSLEDRAGKGPLLAGGDSLWALARHEAPPVEAASYGAEDPARRFRYEWLEEAAELRLHYEGPEADALLTCRIGEDFADWRAEIRMKQGVGLSWAFPAELFFEADRVETFYFPHRLGLGFTKEFFQPHTGAWRYEKLGEQGFQFVAGERCQMRPLQDAPASLKLTEAAKAWLDETAGKQIAPWRAQANRCPEGKNHDLCLIESEHGAFLTGYQLGGWGWLFRFGGFMRPADFRPQFAAVAATIRHVYQSPPSSVPDAQEKAPETLQGKPRSQWPAPPKRIGVLAVRQTMNPGAKVESGYLRWIASLERLPWIKEGGVEVVALADLDALSQALGAPQEWLAVVNPGAELLPAPSADRWQEAVISIKEYVRRGGVWWEAGGGYPFHRVAAPQTDLSLTAAPSALFSDFAHLDSSAGAWSLYGVQAEDSIFAAPEMAIQGIERQGRRAGRFVHRFAAYALEGQTWQSPLLRMTFGRPMRADLEEYGRENGYARGLQEKIAPEKLETLKRCALLKLSAPKLADQIRALDSLPSPMLIHVANYLRGGFDKQYPDHLPPNPAVGTAEELRRLIDRCHERGHLFMPYTNPTWWCIEPKGPTFERAGEAPLSVGLDGKPLLEAYGDKRNRGYTICAYHPAVRAANDKTRGQFTQELPCDILFEDQIGARGPRYDLNPAAPNGCAYLQGIHDIARADCRFAPLGTEDGHDRVINYETLFCGVSWPWLPSRPIRQRVLYSDLWPREAYRIEPLALYLAHDKVLFYHHDLGGFILDRNDLAWSLAFGYGMSFSTARNPADDPSLEKWIECLSRIQQSVGRRCAGQRLDEFEYLTPQVIRSRWGELEIIANLGAAPYALDESATVAPEGFHAKAPGLEAGIFTRYAGEERDGRGWWLIREQKAGRWEEWTWAGDRPAPQL